MSLSNRREIDIVADRMRVQALRLDVRCALGQMALTHYIYSWKWYNLYNWFVICENVGVIPKIYVY